MEETEEEDVGEIHLWDTMLSPFVWTDDKDFQPDIHDFERRNSGVIDNRVHGDDTVEFDYIEAFFD